MKNSYMKTASAVYINYFLLGMVNIMLASNMSYLTEQWDTDAAGISFIISAIGVGKLLSYALSGILSDKIGRKPLVIFSAIAMAVFLIGTPLSPSYEFAFVFALIAGIGNSAMDASSYPGLTEMFPKSAGSANVLVKAFISAGATLLPVMILYFSNNNMYFGYAFFVPAVIFLVNMILLFTVSFPDHRNMQKVNSGDNSQDRKFHTKPIFFKEGLALVLIGFTSTGLFTVSQIWMPTFGQEVVGMAVNDSLKLLSYYSVGGLISVLVLSVLLNKFLRPITVMIIYPMITLASIVIILTIKVPIVTAVTAFFIGFSTAGVFQLAITVMSELFWQRKGTVTGILATASGIAAILMPIVTGAMAKSGAISIIFVFDGVLSAIGFFAACYVYLRYKKVLNIRVINKEGQLQKVK